MEVTKEKCPECGAGLAKPLMTIKNKVRTPEGAWFGCTSPACFIYYNIETKEVYKKKYIR